LNAFAASAIGDAFMQLSAKSTDPNGKNCKRKSLFAIAKVFAVCGLFHHVSPLKGLENLTPVVAWLGCLAEKLGTESSLRLTGGPDLFRKGRDAR
jgi:hypothetical protein